jgi:regulator of protease activity HflC (stomatin/prohibitin superfamily)
MVEILWITVLFIVVAAVILVVLFRAVGFRSQIIYEYQRGIIYVRGRFRGIAQPGKYRLLGSKTILPVDVRPAFITIPGQEVLSADGVTVKISIATQYEISDPDRAINKTQNYASALYLLLQMELRALVSSQKVEAILEARSELGRKLMETVSPKATELGVKLGVIDIKDVMLPGDIKKVFSQVVKAQKEGQAALERARGETAALRNLANAAKMIEDNPNLLQLRALQVMAENSGNTLFFGVPSNAAVAAVAGNGNSKERFGNEPASGNRD